MSKSRWVVALVIGLLLGWVLRGLLPQSPAGSDAASPDVCSEKDNDGDNALPPPQQIADAAGGGDQVAGPSLPDSPNETASADPTVQGDDEPGFNYAQLWADAVRSAEAVGGDRDLDRLTAEQEELLAVFADEATRASMRDSMHRSNRMIFLAGQPPSEPGWAARMEQHIIGVFYRQYPFGQATIDEVRCGDGVCRLQATNPSDLATDYLGVNPVLLWRPLMTSGTYFGNLDEQNLEDPGFSVTIYFTMMGAGDLMGDG
jgi:hypothetical protein